MRYRNYQEATIGEVKTWSKNKPKIFNYVSFEGIDFSNMDLSRMRFRKCNFYKCKFINTNLEYTDLYGCNMCCADFTNADMSFANIRYCKFTKSIFKNTTLVTNQMKNKYNITMASTSNLTKDQIDQANVIPRYFGELSVVDYHESEDYN